MRNSHPRQHAAGEAAAETSLSTERDSEVAAISDAIHAAGMAAPATLALHIVRPVSWIGAQMLWALQPFFGSARSSNAFSITRIAGLLEQEAHVNNLIARLNQPPPRS